MAEYTVIIWFKQVRIDVLDDVDAELLAKVLANPEMKALLASLAKAMK